MRRKKLKTRANSSREKEEKKEKNRQSLRSFSLIEST